MADSRTETETPSLLEDALYLVALSGRALSQDEFSKCFQQKISRHEKIPINFNYACSLAARYGFLVPLRLIFLGMFLIPLILLIMLVRGCARGHRAASLLVKVGCKIILRAGGVRVRNIGRKPMVKGRHIFVANHTTYLDYVVLSSHKYPHAVVAQKHAGLMNFFVNLLQGSVQFERDSKVHRTETRSRLEAFTGKDAVLVFPEGTCVNNEYTVMFQKGAFQMGIPVCPVAIKYNKALGDPYWHTRTQSFSKHFFYVMSRWRTEVSVWWMDPVEAGAGESAEEFAFRVKSLISRRAGLKNLLWNGYLKNCSDPEKLVKMRMKGLHEHGDVLALLKNKKQA
jgi:glycerol-3-phosphate O-acyltransferase 3/4